MPPTRSRRSRSTARRKLVEPAAHARQQFGAFLRERDGARVPTEQRHADLGLECLDLGTDGGGRDAELARCGREAEVGGDRFEDPQGVEWQAVVPHRHALSRVK